MSNVGHVSRTRYSHRRVTRRTHNHSGYLPAITGWEEAYDQSVVDGVPLSPVTYPLDSITPGSVDHTPPDAPTDLVLSSDVVQGSDGKSVLRLIATLTQPTASDLFASYVEVTADSDGNVDPLLEQPVWTNAAVILIGNEATAGFILGVRGATRYWGRAYATDTFSNRSALTAVVEHTTEKDTVPPDVPQNVVMGSGFRGVAAAWDASTAADLMLNEVRYAVDDGTGTGPDTNEWVSITVRSNAIWIGNLDIDVKYWVQVRAVDFSGNVATSDTDPTALDWLSYPEAGWSGLASATPVSVGAADFAANSVIARVISAESISADDIKTGYLKVNTTDGAMIDGIEIWNSGVRVGKWDETGMYIGTNASGLPTDLSGSDYVRITDSGITVYLAGVETSAITPDGINATAINFGALPGGHNLLQNSSFELADFASAPTTETWDVAADWTASELSNTNCTNGAGAVTQTASTY